MSEAVYKIKEKTIKEIADAIRAKAGKTDLINLRNMAEEILSLKAGNVDFTKQTAAAQQVEKGYTFYDKNGVLATGTGNMVKPANMTVYRGSSYPTSPKENDIFVNASTGATYIYISNNWVSLTLQELSYILLNGATVDSSVGFGQYVSTNGAYQTGVLNSSGIYLAGTSNLCKNLWTNSLIDFGKYNQLKVTYNVSASSGDARNFGVFAKPSVSFSWQNGSTTATYSNYQWFAHNPATGTYTQTIDISGWADKMYLGFISECSGGDTLTVTVTKIEFI